MLKLKHILASINYFDSDCHVFISQALLCMVTDSTENMVSKNMFV
jgi:hypothetical protein